MTPEQLAELVYTRANRGSLCLRVGPDALDDAMQDVYLEGLRSLRAGLPIKGDPANYVHGILMHVAARHVRQQIRQRESLRGLEGLDPRLRSNEPDPEYEAARREKRRLLLRSLRMLPPRDRELLVRSHLMDEPWQRTIEVMRLTPTQYRVGKNRAKGKLGEEARLLLQTSNPLAA